MRQTPVLRDPARRGSHGRRFVVVLAGALAALACVRAIAVASDFPYLALLSALAALALGACAVQLARIDDAISWLLTSLVLAAFVIGHVLVLLAGLPGSATARVTPALATITIGAGTALVAAMIGSRDALRRQQPLRTPRLAHPVSPTPAGMESARRAHPDHAHPAA